jgi:hypothetical protein
MTNLSGIVKHLKDERGRVEKQLSALNAALSAFVGEYSGSKSSGTRTMSAAARKKISRAQKARWAKRTAPKSKATAKPKRTMSAAGRKRIAAAQRARWAKARAKTKAKPA